MDKLARLAIALPLLLAAPVAAQDILGPLQDFVDTLTGPPPRPAPRQQQQPAPPRPNEDPPPVPRPRPPELADEPADEPAAPVPEQEADEQEAPHEPEAIEETPPASDAPGEPEEPERVYQVACPAVLRGLVEAEAAPPLSEGICGEQSPLVVTALLVRGRMVPLSTPITTNCQMASALPLWAEAVDGYAGAMLESPLAGIETGTSYMCRNRNNAQGGFTSEHGFANAVDVTGFTLADGRRIGVEADWLPPAEPAGRLLRLAHDAACGQFTTVLGPEANAEHHDHLHLDLGCHGQSCTAQICE